MTNINKLKGRMKEFCYSQSKMADELGISAQYFNSKLNGKVDFKASEIQKISILLDINNKDEYFFIQ